MLPSKFLIDGVDRLGKSTLTESLMNDIGYFLKIHYDKPKALQALGGDRGEYQRQCNVNMFELLRTYVPIIFDRTHLGEMVYAPLYRGYNGDYVLDMEKSLINVKSFTYQEDILLILLTTSNFDIVTDDGQSFDFSKKEDEQEMFKAAFNKSNFTKIMIDVHDGNGGYKSKQQILSEVLNKNSYILGNG